MSVDNGHPTAAAHRLSHTTPPVCLVAPICPCPQTTTVFCQTIKAIVRRLRDPSAPHSGGSFFTPAGPAPSAQPGRPISAARARPPRTPTAPTASMAMRIPRLALLASIMAGSAFAAGAEGFIRTVGGRFVDEACKEFVPYGFNCAWIAVDGGVVVWAGPVRAVAPCGTRPAARAKPSPSPPPTTSARSIDPRPLNPCSAASFNHRPSQGGPTP